MARFCRECKYPLEVASSSLELEFVVICVLSCAVVAELVRGVVASQTTIKNRAEQLLTFIPIRVLEST
eukprot:scaffold8351_cov93-Skeletonema_dohrnii-CCMP3373.AAC.11